MIFSTHFRRLLKSIVLLGLFILAQGCSLSAPLSQPTSQASSTQASNEATSTPVIVPRPSFTPTLMPSPAPTKKIVLKMSAFYHSGQTFITWAERTDLQGEVYRVYRSNAPITAANFASATLMGQVGRDSAAFYANRFLEKTGQPAADWTWTVRFVKRYIIQDLGDQIPEGTGLLVCTLEPQDFANAASGEGYYAVTVIPLGGTETFDAAYALGPLAEAVADPQPVEIKSATDISLSPNAHVFIQYMDVRRWNGTFHAPNPSNNYYGLSTAVPGLASDLQYAYDYVVTTPDPKYCGGKLPNKLPVVYSLHGARSNVDWNEATDPYPDPFCAYIILPEDESDTWYFGFAEHHDYRRSGAVSADDTIVNYTEQRDLRMLYDLEQHPLGPAVDENRVYAVGQSMGASGAMAFAERYPNLIAAAYASQPLTNFLTAGVTNMDWAAEMSVLWGAPSLNLPVQIDAPNHWADALQKYNGMDVWEWQNDIDNASGAASAGRLYDTMAPIGVIFGTIDHVITYKTQGAPTFTALDVGERTWGGVVNGQGHLWQYYIGLPPGLGALPSQTNKYTWIPFWNLSAVKDETVPGFYQLSGNNTAAPGGYYNQTIMWSSSWNPWDGAPVDEPKEWAMSFCSVDSGYAKCGNAGYQTVDIIPRRLQHFVIQPGAAYHWENRLVATNTLVDSGTATADSGGLLVIPGFGVTGGGNRLIITPAAASS